MGPTERGRALRHRGNSTCKRLSGTELGALRGNPPSIARFTKSQPCPRAVLTSGRAPTCSPLPSAVAGTTQASLEGPAKARAGREGSCNKAGHPHGGKHQGTARQLGRGTGALQSLSTSGCPRQPKVMPQVWRRKPQGFYWSVYTCVFLCVSCGCFCVWMYVQTHRCVSTGLHTCSWYAGADRIYGGCGENSSSWLAEWEGRQAWC